MPKHEIRSNAAPLVADGQTVAGYAAVFDSPTDVAGIWTEIVKPGAFRDALASGQDILALYSHELERLLGRRSSGTLRLAEDDKGLKVEIDLPDTTDGRDVGALMQRGDLKGMSFGFCVTKQEWDETTTPPTRTIMAVDLFEVTITADPAYPDTSIGMVDLAQCRRDRNSAAKQSNRTGYYYRKARLDQRQRKI